MTQDYMQYHIDAPNRVLIATMDDPNGRVNVMNDAFSSALSSLRRKLESERDHYSGVIITSGKSTFFAGGDLQEIISVSEKNKDAYFNKVEAIKKDLRRIETLGIPIVAAVNGAALGGGYEICLACHHRIASENPKTKIGLPEATLGLLPGGGGVIRLTRTLGLEAALPYLLSGESLAPGDALKAGLIDDVVPDKETMIKHATAWIKANPAPIQPWDQPGFEIRGSDAASLETITRSTERQIALGVFCAEPAATIILTCALECAEHDIDTASPIETRYLTTLAMSPEAKTQISAFFGKPKSQS